MKNATLKQMRSLVAAIEAGTVAGAADVLDVTPPAVSQQLRLLEVDAGVTLMERGREGLRPTDAGREVLESMAVIEAELAPNVGDRGEQHVTPSPRWRAVRRQAHRRPSALCPGCP